MLPNPDADLEIQLYILSFQLPYLDPLQEAQAYADDNSLLFMETSAKTAMNVNDLFLAIGKGSITQHPSECPFLNSQDKLAPT